MNLTLKVLPQTFAICKLSPDEQTPQRFRNAVGFKNLSSSDDELSLVCDQAVVPEGVQTSRWRSCFKVIWPLDFSLTGITAALAQPLAENNISIFFMATYDTDYLMVPSEKLEEAKEALGEFYAIC